MRGSIPGASFLCRTGMARFGGYKVAGVLRKETLSTC
jgi:hypothetical protein